MPSSIQLLQTEKVSTPIDETVRTSGPFYLGHISNLQLAKGLDLVLDVFRELRAQARDGVRLILAGPDQ